MGNAILFHNWDHRNPGHVVEKRKKPNGGRAEGRASVTAAIAWLSHCAAGSACCRRAKQDD